jgi:hypothetical protein
VPAFVREGAELAVQDAAQARLNLNLLHKLDQMLMMQWMLMKVLKIHLHLKSKSCYFNYESLNDNLKLVLLTWVSEQLSNP